MRKTKYPNYDFFGDIFDDDERHPYKLIKWWFLDACYSYNRSRIKSSELRPRPTWGDEVHYAYREEIEGYRLPVEKLMVEVVALFMLSGRADSEVMEFHGNNIRKVLSENDFDGLCIDFPQDERDYFVMDLKILGFLANSSL